MATPKSKVQRVHLKKIQRSRYFDWFFVLYIWLHQKSLVTPEQKLWLAPTLAKVHKK
jgi:hypothetical protein